MYYVIWYFMNKNDRSHRYDIFTGGSINKV